MQDAALDIRNLEKAYRQGSETICALRHVSLSVGRGEVVALTGPSGSGKSTLLSLVAGFESADSGSIRVGDVEISRMSAARLDQIRTSVIGFVFQQFHLISGLTARENVELALSRSRLSGRERAARAREMLTRFGVGDLAERRPRRLSGGQQQRVAIARALAAAPRLILADEPTAALDRDNAQNFLDELFRLVADEAVSVVVSTHDQRCIERAHRVVVLQDGVVVS